MLGPQSEEDIKEWMRMIQGEILNSGFKWYFQWLETVVLLPPE